jgi:hypothetical protein
MFSLWKDIEAFYDGSVDSFVSFLAGLVVVIAAVVGCAMLMMGVVSLLLYAVNTFGWVLFRDHFGCRYSASA